MSYDSLRDFIERLDREGRLARITQPVSPNLEMTEIQTRLLAEGGPAVLFENPLKVDGTPSRIPVLINIFGTVDRVAIGMNRQKKELRQLGEQLAYLRQPEPPEGWQEALKMFPMIKSVFAMKPKIISNAPCQEVVLTGEDINLAILPIQTCWPGEPAPLITWPMVVTQSDSGTNLGIYRMQVTSKNSTLMRWLRHRGGSEAHSNATGDAIPAAAVIGSDPGTMIAAVSPVPETLSEYQFGGLLREKKIELVITNYIPEEKQLSLFEMED